MSVRAMAWVVRSALWASMLIAAVGIGVRAFGQNATMRVATEDVSYVMPAQGYVQVTSYQPFVWSGDLYSIDGVQPVASGAVLTGADAAEFFPTYQWDNQGDMLNAQGLGCSGGAPFAAVSNDRAMEGNVYFPLGHYGETPFDLLPSSKHRMSEANTTIPCMAISYTDCTYGHSATRPVDIGSGPHAWNLAALPFFMFRMELTTGDAVQANVSGSRCNIPNQWRPLGVFDATGLYVTDASQNSIGLYIQRPAVNEFVVLSASCLRVRYAEGQWQGKIVGLCTPWEWLRFTIYPGENYWSSLLVDMDSDAIVEAIEAMHDDMNDNHTELMALLESTAADEIAPLPEYNDTNTRDRIATAHDAAETFLDASGVNRITFPAGPDSPTSNPVYSFVWPLSAATNGALDDRTITIDMTWYEPVRSTVRGICLVPVVLLAVAFVWREFSPGA